MCGLNKVVHAEEKLITLENYYGNYIIAENDKLKEAFDNLEHLFNLIPFLSRYRNLGFVFK